MLRRLTIVVEVFIATLQPRPLAPLAGRGTG
jgi:hypothetical protein